MASLPPLPYAGQARHTHAHSPPPLLPLTSHTCPLPPSPPPSTSKEALRRGPRWHVADATWPAHRSVQHVRTLAPPLHPPYPHTHSPPLLLPLTSHAPLATLSTSIHLEGTSTPTASAARCRRNLASSPRCKSCTHSHLTTPPTPPTCPQTPSPPPTHLTHARPLPPSPPPFTSKEPRQRPQPGPLGQQHQWHDANTAWSAHRAGRPVRTLAPPLCPPHPHAHSPPLFLTLTSHAPPLPPSPPPFTSKGLATQQPERLDADAAWSAHRAGRWHFLQQ